MPEPVIKPWGSYTDIFRSEEVVFKVITVSPGESISYQTHSNRSEFWYMTQGTGTFRYNDVEYTVESGFSVEVSVGVPHQITNVGEVDLVIYEMQFGQCSETDIERLEDKYDR